MPTETIKELIIEMNRLEAENNHLACLIDDILIHQELNKALREKGGDPILRKMQKIRNFKIISSLKNNLP